MGQRAAQVFAQPCSEVAGERGRVLETGRELFGAFGKPEGLQARRIATPVLADQREIIGVGNQYQAVSAPVAGYLVASGGEPGVAVRALDLHHAALRRLALSRTPALDLPR